MHAFINKRNIPLDIPGHVVNYSSYFGMPYIIQAYYDALSPKCIDFHNRNQEDYNNGFGRCVVAVWRIKSIK